VCKLPIVLDAGGGWGDPARQILFVVSI
jgi:hypothetical protein